MKKLLTLFTLLLCVCSGAWGQTELFSTDFSTWSTENITSGTTKNGVYFHSNSTITNGTGWVFSGNASTSSNFIAIPLSGVNGKITVTVEFPESRPQFKCSVKESDTEITTWSGNAPSVSDMPSTRPGSKTTTLSFDINVSKSYAALCIGKGSNGASSLKSITITTPSAPSTPTLTGAFTPASVEVNQGAATPSIPTYTVTASDASSTAGKYTVTYSLKAGSTDGIFTYTAENGISAISTATAGTATIVATLSNPADGYSIGTATAEYTVTVNPLSNLCKLLEAKYSNGFNSFINEAGKTVTVYYMEGTESPSVTGTPVVSEGATYDVSDASKIIVTAEDGTTTATYTVTRAAVTPYTEVGERAFDGTETWIKTGNSFDATKKWRFSKNDDNWQRETPGQNRIYFFVGPASSIELKTTANVDKGSARNIHVYVNGVKNNDISAQAAMGSYLTIPCNENTNNMVEILSNQTNGDGCISHIINHTVVPVTVTGAKYATFASDNDLDFSAVTGLSAYTASVANTTVTFNEVTGSVKAGDGLLLYADVDANTTYYVPVATDSPALVSGNKLVRGTGASLTYDDGAEYYILSKEGNKVGFYKANGNVVATNKAYLDLTGENAKSFVLPGGETDGIRSIENGELRTENSDYYNLAGQRVGKDYKGIVIVNGKKMLNK